jgi:hypothetical protein
LSDAVNHRHKFATLTSGIGTYRTLGTRLKRCR